MEVRSPSGLYDKHTQQREKFTTVSTPGGGPSASLYDNTCKAVLTPGGPSVEGDSERNPLLLFPERAEKKSRKDTIQRKEQDVEKNKLPVTDPRMFFDKRRKPKLTASKWIAKKCKNNYKINFEEPEQTSFEDEATIQLSERMSKQLDDAKRRGIPLITIDEDPAFKYMKTEYHLQPSNRMRIKVYALTEEIGEYHLKQQFLFLGVKIKLPEYWEPKQTHTCEFYDISPTEQEFLDVKDSLLETLPTAQVVSIQRVQNLFLQTKYYTELCYLSNKNDGNCNQKYLFHGTRNTDPKEILRSQEGFDSRLSSKTNLWGPGIYFAEEAKYADGFAYKTGVMKQLILASVALGIYFDYEKLCNPTLTTPPMNIETKKYYDSVSGITRDSRVYTIFNSYQACPRYLISYFIKDATTE